MFQGLVLSMSVVAHFYYSPSNAVILVLRFSLLGVFVVSIWFLLSSLRFVSMWCGWCDVFLMVVLFACRHHRRTYYKYCTADSEKGPPHDGIGHTDRQSFVCTV